MPLIYPDHAATVGNTPLVELGRLRGDRPGRLLAKLEHRNPCGSVKDRLALGLVDDAEMRGALGPGGTLIEATGGNTGIGLAFVAAIRGYRLVLTMPESMSAERLALLRHLGAEVELSAGILMTDAVARARQLADELRGAVLLDQFSNPANSAVHERTTGPEIWRDTNGAVDVFVSAVGTGGTLTGVARAIKPLRPALHTVAVEPASAAVLSGRPAGQHQMPGIGVGFVPSALDRSLVDEVIAVTDDAAFDTCRLLATTEGIVAGVSSGAALAAALTVAERSELSGKTIVVLLADSGERYLSSALFSAKTDDPPSEPERKLDNDRAQPPTS